jgi:hypothetical protein
MSTNGTHQHRDATPPPAPAPSGPTPAATIDRADLLRLCRRGVDVIVASRSPGGADCIARGRVMAVTERHLTLETRGLQTIVAIARVMSVEPVAEPAA